MLTRTIAIVGLLAILQPAYTNALTVDDLPDEVKAEITAWCASQWPDDNEMVVYCIETEREAARQAIGEMLRAIETQDMDSFKILRACADDWPTEWRMVLYCFEQQTEARQKLDRLLNN